MCVGGGRSKDRQLHGSTGRAAEEAQGHPRTHSRPWAIGRILAFLLRPRGSRSGLEQTDPTGRGPGPLPKQDAGRAGIRLGTLLCARRCVDPWHMVTLNPRSSL